MTHSQLFSNPWGFDADHNGARIIITPAVSLVELANIDLSVDA